MEVREIMKTGIEAFREDDTVQVVARRMKDMGTGFVPICDRGGRPVGTITDYDVVCGVCVEDRLASRVTASEVMNLNPVTCHESTDIRRVEDLMDDSAKARVLVVDDAGRLVGVVTLADVFGAEAEEHRAVETARHVMSREYLA